ncbi:MAG: phosphatidylserine decarboxylase [Methanotrichaceae archaeon]|nr:phosphatidylserine decarboxylase [Methanotrichaceae archaeon]
MRLARGSAAWITTPIILTAALAAAGQWWGFALALVGSAFMVFFHRDPDRIPEGDGMLSPADGIVVVAEPGRLAIFMNAHNVHVNRAPLDGLVRAVCSTGDGHAPAFLARSIANRQKRIDLDTGDGPMQVHQIAGFVVRQIVTYIHPGDPVKRGERIGMIRFGSRVEVTMPPGYQLVVGRGDRVLGGQTVIAVKLA